LEILKDPRVQTTQAEFDEQVTLLLKMRDSLNEIYDGVRIVREVRRQAKDLIQQLGQACFDVKKIQKAADSLFEKLTKIEEELMQPKNTADQDTENFPTKLDNQLAYVYMKLDSTDNRPTDGQKERFQDLEREKAALLTQLRFIIDTDLAAFNGMIQQLGTPAIILPAPTKKKE
jgi:uncharacterized coiled-coil DUF342 family protein